MSDSDLEINLGDMGPAPGSVDMRLTLKGFKATARQALANHLELIQVRVDAAIEKLDLDAIIDAAIEVEVQGVVSEVVKEAMKYHAERVVEAQMTQLQRSVGDAVQDTIKQLAAKHRGT